MLPYGTFQSALLAIEKQLTIEQTCFSSDVQSAYKLAKVVKVDAKQLYNAISTTRTVGFVIDVTCVDKKLVLATF
jgi:hypothetical protein